MSSDSLNTWSHPADEGLSGRFDSTSMPSNHTFPIKWPENTDDNEPDLLRGLKVCDDDVELQRSIIAAAQARIEADKEERTSLEEQLFQLRAPRAPIQRLNDDLLALIFERGRETIELPRQYANDHVHWNWRCSTVCWRWHNVVHSTPLLWTDIEVLDSEGAGVLVRLWEKYPYTRARGLKLMLHPQSSTCCRDPAWHAAVQLILLRSANHLQHLVSRGCLHDADNVMKGIAACGELESLTWELGRCDPLSLRGPLKPISGLDFRSFPTLHSIDIQDPDRGLLSMVVYTIFWPTADASTLRTVKLSRIYINPSTFRALVRACPALSSLTLDDIRFQFTDDGLDPQSRHKVPSLETLIIRLARPDEELVSELRQLHFPRLTTLSLTCDPSTGAQGPNESALPGLLSFISRQYSVRSASFTAWLGDLLLLLPVLAEPYLLSLQHLHLSSVEIRMSHFRPLGWESGGTEGDGGRSLLVRSLRSCWRHMRTACPEAEIVLSPSPDEDILEELREGGVRISVNDRWP